jgi:quinol monooxygenase YgiN
MPLHVFVRFEPIPGKECGLRDELHRVVKATRAEAGCLRIHLFQSIREPLTFCIHSEWVDEAAFDAHSKFPHMQHFLAIVPGLISHPIKAIRTERID